MFSSSVCSAGKLWRKKRQRGRDGAVQLIGGSCLHIDTTVVPVLSLFPFLRLSGRQRSNRGREAAAAEAWLVRLSFSFTTSIRGTGSESPRARVMPFNPVAPLETSHYGSHFYPTPISLYFRSFIEQFFNRKRVQQILFAVHSLMGYLLTRLSHFLCQVWSSPLPVRSYHLAQHGLLWAAGKSSAAMCGESLPTRSTFPTWSPPGVTWRYGASPMSRMNRGCWSWTLPSGRAGRGNSRWRWMLGRCTVWKRRRSSPSSAPACLFWCRPSVDWSESWKAPWGPHKWTKSLWERSKQLQWRHRGLKNESHNLDDGNTIKLYLLGWTYQRGGRWQVEPPRNLWGPPAAGCRHSTALSSRLHPPASWWVLQWFWQLGWPTQQYGSRSCAFQWPRGPTLAQLPKTRSESG